MALLEHIEFLTEKLDVAVFQYTKYIKILLTYGYNPDECDSGYFVLLSDEILMKIFDYLCPYDKIYKSQICFRFYNLMLSNRVWKRKYPLLKASEALISLNIHNPLWWHWLVKNNNRSGFLGDGGKIGKTGYITRDEDDSDEEIYFLYEGDTKNCYDAQDWKIPHGIGVLYQIEKSKDIKPVMRYAGKWVNGKAEGIGIYYHTDGNKPVFDWKQ